MPLINIEYDDKVLTQDDAIALSKGIQEIVSKVTDIKDVFVYANSAKIKVQIAPVEIFIRMSSSIMQEKKNLIEEMKTEIKNWKSKTSFSQPINLTLIPMNWKIEMGL